MDQSYQLYFFILSTTTLFADIKPTGVFSYDWFDAQDYCLGQGLTIERDKSDQPYWTGIYRRLTPWINILGCYPDSIETLQNVVKKTMTISSVGMCQEMCYHENIHKFAVKMNNCLCIENNTHVNTLNRLLASECNIKCGDNSDDIYLRECGGESAYNIYEIPEVYFNSVETCLSLQCSAEDTRFIPQKCSKTFEKVCENMKLPENSFASSWSLSMEQCRKSQPSTYLLGDVNLNNPLLVCSLIPRQPTVVWVGVARKIYTSIDQGWEIKEEQRATFLECEMCTNHDCQFTHCSDSLSGSIFCKSISNTPQSQITENVTTSHLFASSSTTGNYEKDILALTNDTLQMSGSSDNLVLKISLPLTVGFITLLVCLVGVVLYKRRSKMMKTGKTTNAEVKFVPQKQVYSELDFAQGNSSFALEHCYQEILKGSNSLNESPYNSSEEIVNDHLRDKLAGERERNNIYQNASIDMTGDMPGYDTIVNTVNKNHEEEATYDHLHQDANETY